MAQILSNFLLINLKPYLQGVSVSEKVDSGSLSPTEKSKMKEKKIELKIPALPNLWKIETELLGPLIYSFNTMVLVHPEPETAVHAGLRIFHELLKVWFEIENFQ